jgi:glucokinase
MTSYAIGVDLGGTNLRVAAVAGDGSVLARTALKVDVKKGRDEVIGALCDAVKQVSQQSARAAGDGALRGIGIGVPGLIDSETGRLLESPNLPGWNDYDIKGEIERRLGSTVILENDANCAAMGELWLGAGRGLESLCMYTLGTGVGGGLVLKGLIWHGWNGMAGELGHFNVEPEGHRCGCGSWGCLEQYASATAVVRLANEAVAAGAPTRLCDLAPEQLSAQAVHEYAIQGDAAAQSVFERVGRTLGIGIANMVNALNLPLYVVGGGVAGAWDAFAPAMFDEVRKRSFIYAGTTALDGRGTNGRRCFTRICQAKLGGDSGLYGAARLPMIETERNA